MQNKIKSYNINKIKITKVNNNRSNNLIISKINKIKILIIKKQKLNNNIKFKIFLIIIKIIDNLNKIKHKFEAKL